MKYRDFYILMLVYMSEESLSLMSDIDKRNPPTFLSHVSNAQKTHFFKLMQEGHMFIYPK